MGSHTVRRAHITRGKCGECVCMCLRAGACMCVCVCTVCANVSKAINYSINRSPRALGENKSAQSRETWAPTSFSLIGFRLDEHLEETLLRQNEEFRMGWNIIPGELWASRCFFFFLFSLYQLNFTTRFCSFDNTNLQRRTCFLQRHALFGRRAAVRSALWVFSSITYKTPQTFSVFLSVTRAACCSRLLRHFTNVSSVEANESTSCVLVLLVYTSHYESIRWIIAALVVRLCILNVTRLFLLQWMFY